MLSRGEPIRSFIGVFRITRTPEDCVHTIGREENRDENAPVSCRKSIPCLITSGSEVYNLNAGSKEVLAAWLRW